MTVVHGFTLGVAVGLILAPLAYLAGGLLAGNLHEKFVTA